jgi:GNAT superfamily N-acetyltransferase
VTENGANVATLEHFGVLEDKRRRGLGKQLLQAIIEV